MELPLEVLGRLPTTIPRVPESRELEVCQMVHWKHVVGFMFTLLVPNIVKKQLMFLDK